MTSGLAVRPGGTSTPAGGLRQAWIVVTTLLLAAVFAEAVFAGAMLSGAGWARSAHAMSAVVLAIWTAAAGPIALVTLRGVSQGPRLVWTLAAMAVLVVLQAALGALTAKGANLLWAHVPLGVALVGLAGQTAAAARRLGQA
jgi:hypothetical protein